MYLPSSLNFRQQSVFIYLFKLIRLITDERVKFSCLVLFYLLESNINLFVCVHTPSVVFNQGNSTLFLHLCSCVKSYVSILYDKYLWVCTEYCFCVIFSKVASTIKGSLLPLQEGFIFRLTDIVLLGIVI